MLRQPGAVALILPSGLAHRHGLGDGIGPLRIKPRTPRLNGTVG